MSPPSPSRPAVLVPTGHVCVCGGPRDAGAAACPRDAPPRPPAVTVPPGCPRPLRCSPLLGGASPPGMFPPLLPAPVPLGSPRPSGMSRRPPAVPVPPGCPSVPLVSVSPGSPCVPSSAGPPPLSPSPWDVPVSPQCRSPRDVPVRPPPLPVPPSPPLGMSRCPPSVGLPGKSLCPLQCRSPPPCPHRPGMSPCPSGARPPGMSPSPPAPPRPVPVSPPRPSGCPRVPPVPVSPGSPRPSPPITGPPLPAPRPGADGAAAAGAGLELRSAGLRRRLRGWAEALPSETHLVLRGPAGARAWRRAAALRGELRGEPAWSRALPPEPRRPPPLPLLPGGGFATPRPPFFAPLPAGVRARRLALGHEHALALGDAGQVHAWGGGRHGQLGHGTLESELQPRLVEALAGVPMQAVAAGGWHSASVSEAGDLYVWGWNESGQLALPSKALAEERVQDGDAGAGDTMLTPRQEQPAAEGTAFISIQAFPALLDLPQDLEVTEVSCGSRHTAVVTRGGELYTWGWGKYGQLGHGDNSSSDQPRRVDYLVAEGLQAEEVVCGPWTTYVHVLEP
ncbi:RCC1 domain-containing protein 1 isoform X4 [Larus michahellis]|uniref:RCC1 domain-containing protein 1 isoform X4 n=1 Tax=Larus michahellis TaxID=119627 RepID=UPI003D9BF20A